ncbi:MAG: hypothetical protein R2827_04110 [Bdellovibrionales bacterium]
MGIPGVNYRVMLESLQLSRKELVKLFCEMWENIGYDLSLMKSEKKNPTKIYNESFKIFLGCCGKRRRYNDMMEEL